MTDMTPENLRNVTPDNLRKLAQLIKMGQPLQPVAVSEALDLCASAWRVDQEKYRLLATAVDDWDDEAKPGMADTLIRQQARTEALETFAAVAKRFHGAGSVCEQNRARRMTICEICDGLVALAAGVGLAHSPEEANDG